ncbi:MAG: Hemerythrin cation binding domain protein [Gammaproteobacteria bacterium]|jgi:hemerythrin superfamily protein|nr:Hemerythrin cation binding domain protein [Gammaproteobacteria bacterium]
MNIYEYLKKDHEKVNDLLEKFFSLPKDDFEEQESLFEEIMEEVLLHSQTEEKSFYRALEDNSETQGDIEHSFEEHVEVENLLDEIASLSAEDSIWLEKMKALQKAIQHHVKFEEEEVFAKAKKILDENQAKELVKEMEKLKQEETMLPSS